MKIKIRSLRGGRRVIFCPKATLDERLGFLCILGFGGLLTFESWP
jgi:hypothetical protein